MPEAAGAKTPSRFIHWGLIAMTLVVLAASTAILTLHVRGVLQAKIMDREGEALSAAAKLAQQLGGSEEDLNSELPIEDLVYMFSRVKEILAMRIMDAEGNEVFRLPEKGVIERPISAESLGKLRNLQPVSRFEKDLPLGAIFSPDVELALPLELKVPLIDSYIPLEHQGELVGIASIVLNGRKLADALTELDRDLLLFACLIFVVGGTIIGIGMAWAFGRLHKANRLLLKRTESLAKANHQLALAAKTSAIGAVTAHLIHDLKSPLFGLEHFVSSRGGNDDEDREEWEMALGTTRRMQKVISDVVRILQEEKGDLSYEITIEEIGGLLRKKLEADCQDAQLRLEVDVDAKGKLNNKDGNLILLIATNIIQNAMQATPKGGAITFRARESEEHFLFEIQDTGPGLPPNLLKTLFAPCRSGKKGGTGLGLAISKQLANHMNAELVLKETSEAGTTFQLRVSKEILVKEEEEDSELVLP